MSISVTLTSIYTRESMGGMHGRRSSLHLREKVALWLEKEFMHQSALVVRQGKAMLLM